MGQKSPDPDPHPWTQLALEPIPVPVQSFLMSFKRCGIAVRAATLITDVGLVIVEVLNVNPELRLGRGLVAAVGAGILDAIVHTVNVHLQVILGHVGLWTVLAGVPNIFVPGLHVFFQVALCARLVLALVTVEADS